MVSMTVDATPAKTGRPVLRIDRLTSVEVTLMIGESALSGEVAVASPLRSVTARAHPPSAPDE